MIETTDIANDWDYQFGKIEDAGELVHGGRIDHYWEREGIQDNISSLFNENPRYDWLQDQNKALKHFNLRSIEFGNWMSQEDRANFLYGSMLSLQHLAKLFRIKDSLIGLGGKLSISLGARGTGKAAGHYEPNPFAVINITKTQGIGVLAHEFAHALDNIISFHTKSKQTYVSGGRTTRKGYDEAIAEKGNFFEQKFEEFFNILYFDNKGNKTNFLEELDLAEDYWNRRNEVFARTMEVYVSEKLASKGIVNKFLVSGTKGKMYPKPPLVKKVSTLIGSIVKNSFQLLKDKGLGGFSLAEIDYKGFRKTIKENASLNDTLSNMQRIAYRDTYQVKELAKSLEGLTVKQTAQNIWNYLRENTRYKLDTSGIEELRTPARSLVDGKLGLTNPDFGIDCDDYTILVSAMLLSLGIHHEYRIASYNKKGRFEHIYPVAFDLTGEQFVIDIVPEIPHFNYEAKPIIDLKIVTMELQELSGIVDAETKNDLIEELNEPFSLSGIENDLEDDILESNFLSGLGEVDTEEEAEIVLSGADISQMFERGILAEVNKARMALIAEEKSPTELSNIINVPNELQLVTELMEAWDDEQQRREVIDFAIQSKSAYANFYKSLNLGLDEVENELLNGLDDDEPIFLARVGMDEFDLSELIDEGEEDSIDGLGRRRKKRRGRLKKFFKKVGGVAKKVAKAMVRFNPATITLRASILLVLKTNLAKVASRLIYGYLTEQQAIAQNLDLAEWRKLQGAVGKAEKFFTKIGGKADKFRTAIVKGRAAKKTGLSLNGLDLGVVATATAGAAASGFMLFVKKLLSKVNVGKLFRNIKAKRTAKKLAKAGVESAVPSDSLVDETDFTDTSTANQTRALTTTDAGLTKPDTPPTDTPPEGFMNKVKAFWGNHKKKIIGIGLGGIIVIIALLFWSKWKKKKKRSLAGIKAAKTRAKNRKALGSAKRKSTPRTLKGSTTILKIPSKSVSKARISKRSNGQRLKLMHKKAQELKKTHPKTKYSTLLKKASKLI